MSDAAAQHHPQRLLIFGGTFDPPHRAHVELPTLAARELKCDRIIYIPAAINPLKSAAAAPPPTPAAHRLAMLRLALQDVPNAEISTIELDRAGVSYTIDTLRALTASLEPQASGLKPALFLLIGADQALDFHRWKDWQEILQLATPAVMLREPWTSPTFLRALRERYGERQMRLWEQQILRVPMIAIGATDVRRHVREGRPLIGLVHPQVEAYIKAHGLYEST